MKNTKIVYRVRHKETGTYHKNLSTGTTIWQRRADADRYKAGLYRGSVAYEVVEFELREVTKPL